MKKLIAFILATAMAVCAADTKTDTHVPMPGKHHDKRTYIIVMSMLGAGAATGVILGLRNRSCPHRIMYEGVWYPYDGTPPCPTNPAQWGINVPEKRK